MFHHHHHHHHHHHQSGSYELCSSFYTNNPLLYVSHYSEIIVATGYDIKETKGTGGSSLLQSDPLSSRRELVELLDSEPLFDYLIQNGVLTLSQTDHIRAEKSPAKQNLLLLRQVDETGRKGLVLFLNALRMTGQHYLANHLDDGDRITAFNVLQSTTRHIGQVSVFVRASSIRLAPSMTIAVSTLLPQDWITMDDIHQTISLLKQPINKRPMRHLARHLSSVRRSSLTSDTSSLSDVNIPAGSIQSLSERNLDRKRLCLLKCFSSLFRRQGVKSRSITTTFGSASSATSSGEYQSKPEIHAAVNCELTSDFYGDTNIELKNDVHLSLMDRPLVSSMATGKALAAAVAVAAGNCGFLKTPSGVRPSFRIGSNQRNHLEQTETSASATEPTGCKTPFQHRLTVESLRKLASTVQSSYEALYVALTSDALASTRDVLVRYMEQERSVLVLETTRTQDGVGVICICTKSSQLETLWRDYSLERLQMDLEDRLVTKELLVAMNALGLRLDVEIGREEIDLATAELTGSWKSAYST